MFFLQGPTPLAEIFFWQERAFILSALNEQLEQPAVEKILKIMTKAEAGVNQTLSGTVAELTKYRVEAEDNKRFLNTLERHFTVSFFKTSYFFCCFQ